MLLASQECKIEREKKKKKFVQRGGDACYCLGNSTTRSKEARDKEPKE